MDAKFIIKQQGRDFVLYAGLIDMAHGQGLKSIRTTLLQAPAEENRWTAIISAEVETERGVFTGIGDASPDNVSRMLMPHYIRLGETRAKARALRDALNISVTAFEELGDPEPDLPPAPGGTHTGATQNGRTEHPSGASALKPTVGLGSIDSLPDNTVIPGAHGWWTHPERGLSARMDRADALGIPFRRLEPGTATKKEILDLATQVNARIKEAEAKIPKQ